MTDAPHAYDFAAIEARWQQFWESRQTFRAPNPGDPGFDPRKPKFYVLDMFPYPSGVGLHVGHPLGYIATDILARYKRMRGFNVLHPMGFDAFGLPAEQYAIETGVHPRITTQRNIDNMTRQLKRLGMGYDWSRAFATTDPGYVKWTQWIFLQLYHSYFDPIEKKAQPISTLVDKLQNEQYFVGLDGELIYSGLDEDMQAIGGITSPDIHKWHELSPDQQQRLLDEYRLAYMADVEVNWCPQLGTVLANEEVTSDGRSERGNYPVFKRPLRQWMLRITAYADRLIDDLDLIDWPQSIKLLQRNWIGRSEGALVDFTVDVGEVITVFTTRPDTLFGSTYMVLAPEHPLVDQITTPDQRNSVNAYIELASSRSSVDRAADAGGKEKTGVFTGAYAINPVNNQRIPIWIADYVMMGYGTGAIMAVPAHDQRDYEFAKKFNLPIVQVVGGGDVSQSAFSDEGVNVNSANSEVSLNGLPTAEAKAKITDWLVRKRLGRAQVQYKLRDWLFSRQRYWGEPFPILHGPNGEIRPVDEKDLPVELPELDDFKPHGTDDPNAPPQPPLGRAPASWKHVTLDGVQYTREFNTMPNWAGSCWYYLRYLDPRNDQRLVGREPEHYWMLSRKSVPGTLSKVPGTLLPFHSGGVDLYVGGVEHAVLHLLYARFWHKVLYDLGHVSTPEPFGRLFSQGYIQAYCYRDSRGIAVPAEEVVNKDGKPAAEVQGAKGQKFFHNGNPVTEEYGKMGKSLKNAIAPDDVCNQFGCDTLRLYEMYLGPLDQSKIWSTADIIGISRFLNRLWRTFIDDSTGNLRVTDVPPSDDQLRWMHRTIQRVTDDMDGLRFNTAIAALIELNNELTRANAPIPRALAETIAKLLAPLAPHLSEELWQRLGHEPSVADLDWPAYDPRYLVQDTIELPVQVLGKLRSRITIPADASEDAIKQAALADEKIQPHLAGKTVRKVIIVPGKMVNIVVG